jgi:hypothetical protein
VILGLVPYRKTLPTSQKMSLRNVSC